MRSTVFFLTAAILAVLLLAARSGLTQLRDLNLAQRDKTTASNKGALGTVRSALQVYYGDHEGRFPTDNLTCLTENGKYLAALPVLWSGKGRTLPHPPGAGVIVYSPEGAGDTGKFLYYNDPADSQSWGNFIIDCTHLDAKGGPWSSY